jgi:transposase
MKRRYDQAFRREAIRLALTGEKTIVQTARDLGIKASCLYAWINKAKQSKESIKDGDKKLTSAELIAELNRLKKENNRLKEEREILKKAAIFFAKEEQKK